MKSQCIKPMGDAKKVQLFERFWLGSATGRVKDGALVVLGEW